MSRDFKPNLAGTPKGDDVLPMPCYASPKLDGIRGAVKTRQLLSRSLIPIPNKLVQSILSLPELHGLDGELIVGPANGPNVMQATTSVVMSNNKMEPFGFHVFDYWDSDAGFEERIERAEDIVMDVAANWRAHMTSLRLEGAPVFLQECPLVLVPQKLITSLDELSAYEAEMLEAGYEGVMVRDPDGKYKFGRSTVREGGLLKLKRFTDGEAVIVGFVEEMKNNNAKQTNELGRTKRSSHKAGKEGKGTLGAFVCKQVRAKTMDGRIETFGPEFNIGSGIGGDLGDEVWANRAKYEGRIVKFKHFEHGVVDAPRHPVFLGFRDKRDM